MDKVLKLLEIDRKPGNNLNAQNIQINFISQSPPDQEDHDTVEGEIVKDSS